MSELSTTAERTRRAILTAAVEVLAYNSSAPLADIAERAGVSRSTFHRYFADRSALRAAISEMAADRWKHAVAGARLQEGTGLEAFQRLCSRLMDSLDVLVWWMTELGATDDLEESPEDREIAEMIQRGHQDGTIDSQLSVEWLSNSVWSILYAVQFIPAELEGKLSSFDARQQAMRTLMKAAAADPSAV